MTKPFDHNVNNYQRLAWACRRGMLELDVLLMRFLKERYAYLSLPQQQQFQALLTHADPELYDWLMGREETPHAELRDIIEAIRAQNDGSVRF